jgi:hypothetical protein
MKFDLRGWENISLIHAYHLRITPIIIMIVENICTRLTREGLGVLGGKGHLINFHV